MALLLAETCQTSIIATICRTEESDPNEHGESRSAYKRALRQLVDIGNPKPAWLIDLHGSSEGSDRMAPYQKVDLGTGGGGKYLPIQARQKLVALLDTNLGAGATAREGKRGWDAEGEHRMAAYSHTIGLSSVQVEMKPSVRVALRRTDASMYRKVGPYSADAKNVIAMLQALVDFIEFLKTPPVDTRIPA